MSAHPACATVVLYCEAHEPIDQDTSKLVCLCLTTMCGPVMDSDSDTSEGDYHSDDEVSFYTDQVKPFHSAGGTIKLTFALPVGLCLGSARVLGPLAGGESVAFLFPTLCQGGTIAQTPCAEMQQKVEHVRLQGQARCVGKQEMDAWRRLRPSAQAAGARQGQLLHEDAGVHARLRGKCARSPRNYCEQRSPRKCQLTRA